MDIEQARTNMIKQQLRPLGVLNDTLLQRFKHIPREKFVPLEYQSLAFADVDIPLMHGQTMLSPTIQALMLHHLAIQSHESVLEIGTGTGYLTALIGSIAESVVSVDIFSDFTRLASVHLAILPSLVNSHITLQSGNAAHGWLPSQSFDVILITGALPSIVDRYKYQLTVGGRLLMIVGNAPVMQVVCLTRESMNVWHETYCFEMLTQSLIDAPLQDAFVF